MSGFCTHRLAKPFEAPDSSEWRQVRDPVGGFGGVARRPSDHQGIHQIHRICRHLVDSWRGSRRPLRQNFFCAGHRVGCAGPPPREKLVSKTLGRPGCLRLARSGKSPRLVAKELRSFSSQASYRACRDRVLMCSARVSHVGVKGATCDLSELDLRSQRRRVVSGARQMYLPRTRRGSCDPAEWTAAHRATCCVPPSTRRGRSCLWKAPRGTIVRKWSKSRFCNASCATVKWH